MTEDEAVAQAAERYRADGYEVEVRPDRAALPDEFRDRRPALLARRDGLTIAAEVWDRERLTDLPPTATRPGWKFELIMLPRPPAEPVITGAAATPAFAGQLLGELDNLLPRGAAQARFLLAWSAAEAALRVAAERNGLPANRIPPRQLLSELTGRGVLTYDRTDRLYRLMTVRNHLAHGSPTDPPAAADVDFLAGLARELLAADAVAA